ncbi:c-type cytochrome [Roseibaca sp. Y0-43]|uniref:c-type cytochrome n=1 Tax=Roseibaca sp. Y0-43 TaxID=2816854 RepID=UPI001D0BFC71|nr:cytochrome c [Roseibaca sp. Y0-43]MCC1482157.1 cytochrome c [Roseibaca sp. Y0-43]
MTRKLAAAALVILGAAIVWFNSGHDAQSVMVEVDVPELGATEQEGAELFAAQCASCHGPNAAGKDGVGPPLVHVIYEPGHHSDMSFFLAARMGVRAHHWSFGNMPAQPQVSDADVAKIVTYIRALQRANGIY